ncbi:hypothetical protein ACFWDQ_08455, partial [Streptomyces sp. NPDC060053]|uniref:hypothetical protein n=1 Tax=Streptomyces sp. NPDC060053 TaxID=3347047 RepID=UPI003697C37D
RFAYEGQAQPDGSRTKARTAGRFAYEGQAQPDGSRTKARHSRTVRARRPAQPDGSRTKARHSRFADAAPLTGRAAGAAWEVLARGYRAFHSVSAYADALSGPSRPSR